MSKYIRGAILISLLAGHGLAYDVYQSSSPAPGTPKGALCGVFTSGYLYSVCISSPVSNSFTQVYGDTISASAIPNSSFKIANTGTISAQNQVCINYLTNMVVPGQGQLHLGMSYGTTGQAQITYTYSCHSQ